MKILVLKSSGNKKGSSNMLADEFIKGASKNGHEVTEFDVIRKKINPCLGCGACGMNGACVQKDDYENELKGLLKETDVIVFAFPVYYFGWPAQIKAVVDRFYSHTMELTNMHKKPVMLTLAWNDDEETFAVTKAYYDKICDYMQFENLGSVVGKGCGTPSMTAGTDYPKMAYELGLSI